MEVLKLHQTSHKLVLLKRLEKVQLHPPTMPTLFVCMRVLRKREIKTKTENEIKSTVVTVCKCSSLFKRMLEGGNEINIFLVGIELKC